MPLPVTLGSPLGIDVAKANLPGHTVGEVFGRATAFLELAAAKATAGTDATVHAAR